MDIAYSKNFHCHSY